VNDVDEKIVKLNDVAFLDDVTFLDCITFNSDVIFSVLKITSYSVTILRLTMASD
jgi:hypothetical protein